ncbi:hypothetical protein V6N11_004682 [Hibiscus sabdariffa]|uniref:Endonuclease/exonuclease/phosphatase domain-containing protein n=1 Tax=Hibiscus sabdariffa TaxID=183260 RepID=A0ABR2SH47_9ROSI
MAKSLVGNSANRIVLLASPSVSCYEFYPRVVGVSTSGTKGWSGHFARWWRFEKVWAACDYTRSCQVENSRISLLFNCLLLGVWILALESQSVFVWVYCLLSFPDPDSGGLSLLVSNIPTLLVGFAYAYCFVVWFPGSLCLILEGPSGECPCFSSMVILAWNVRGLGNRETTRTLRNSIQKFQTDIVFLSETKQQRKYLEKTKVKMKLTHSYFVEPDGLAGGLSLWWTKETQITILRSGKHFIDAKISVNGEEEWFGSFIYGPPYREDKQEFWEMMTNLRNDSEECWLVIGDTNVVTSQEEKLGGAPFNPNDARVYYDFIDYMSLLELPISGGTFTWSNQRSDDEAILEKIGRAMCSLEWSARLPKVVGMLDVAIGSDHAPIIILPQGLKKKYKRDFKFESKWLLEEECTTTVRTSWETLSQPSPSHRFGSKLRKTKFSLIKWSKLKARINNQRKQELLEKIKLYQGKQLSKMELANSKGFPGFAKWWEKINSVPDFGSFEDGSSLIAFLLWAVWKSRNRLVFEGTLDTPLDVWKRAEGAFTKFMSAQPENRPSVSSPLSEQILWSPPPVGCFKKLVVINSSSIDDHMVHGGHDVFHTAVILDGLLPDFRPSDYGLFLYSYRSILILPSCRMQKLCVPILTKSEVHQGCSERDHAASPRRLCTCYSCRMPLLLKGSK